MVEQVVALCQAMGAQPEQETLLRPLVQAACEGLRSRLREGVTPEDCGSAFPLAVAMIAMDGLSQATGEARVASFTAGEVSIRRAGGTGHQEQAQRLMQPWLGAKGFAFLGVRG